MCFLIFRWFRFEFSHPNDKISWNSETSCIFFIKYCYVYPNSNSTSSRVITLNFNKSFLCPNIRTARCHKNENPLVSPILGPALATFANMVANQHNAPPLLWREPMENPSVEPNEIMNYLIKLDRVTTRTKNIIQKQYSVMFHYYSKYLRYNTVYCKNKITITLQNIVLNYALYGKWDFYYVTHGLLSVVTKQIMLFSHNKIYCLIEITKLSRLL